MLDIMNVEFISYVIDVLNVLCEDVVIKGLDCKEVLKNVFDE